MYIANYHTFNYGARTGFRIIYTFFIYVNNLSYIYCSANQTLGNWDGELTRPHKLTYGTKPPVSNLGVLFFPCVVRKAAAHIDTKALNVCHKSKKGFQGISVGIPQHKKG